MKNYIFGLLATFIALSAAAYEGELGRVEITPVFNDLDEPWSIAFLPNGYLITERDGRLNHFNENGNRHIISGTPKVQTDSQAGLFDVLVPKNFAQSGEIFLSYAKGDGAGTAVARANFDPNQSALTNFKEIFVINSPSRSGHHFGGRLVEAADDALFLTIGDRGDRYLAQDPEVNNGSVVRIQKDGSGYQTISKGHRNPQGAALDNDGQLFIHEHGAKGGDEINEIVAGQNYGWPVISYGVNYDGTKIGEGTKKAGLEEPRFYWDPSIAPSGMAIHSGRNWPEAEDLFFIGSLKFDQIAIVSSGAKFKQIGVIQTKETARVRDVREAPDGSIWFLSVVNGAAYRIVPKP